MRRLVCTATLLLLFVFVVGCNGAEQVSRLDDPQVSYASTHAACEGARQSPINLTNAQKPGEATLLHTEYRTVDAVDQRSGTGTVVTVEGGTLTIQGQTYTLDRMEVRTPGEHTIDGDRYAAEIQLVHRGPDGSYAILGIPVAPGDRSNEEVEKWLDHGGSSFSYNVARLLPSPRSYYTYEGSLTRPPCTETARWMVMDTPLRVGDEQIQRLRSEYGRPARPLQSRNDRTIVHVAP